MRKLLAIAVMLAAAACGGNGATTADRPPASTGSPKAGAPPTAAEAEEGLADVQEVKRRDVLDTAGLAHGGEGEALRFHDRNGNNIVVLSLRDSGRTVRLEGDHVVVSQDGSRRVLRRVRDWVQDCELDITAEFIPGSLRVDDRDGDGLGEVSFAYELACRSDVSPSDLKLLVLEDGDKYIIRGQRIIPGVEGMPPASPGVPEPQASAWPRNAYPAAARSFRQYQQG